MRDDELLVTIGTFETTFEASLARGALEAIGIRALVPEETLVGSRSAINGGATLQVFTSDAARASDALTRMQIRIVPNPES